MDLPDGFSHFAGFLTAIEQEELLVVIREIVREAPLYRPGMPRSGKALSVEMTNCGPLGWVTDKERGYRYQSTHPVTGRPWPAIPHQLLALWERLARYPSAPEACLVNLYRGNAKMGQHRDADEADTSAPVLSVSLGDDAVFSLGGLTRKDVRQRLILHSGDVVLLGSASRLAYHGVDRVLPGTSQLLPGGGRINLTLRRVTVPVTPGV